MAQINHKIERNKFYVCGLGNYGERYRYHRHNYGAIVVEYLQEHLKFSLKQNKFCHVYEGVMNETPVTLLVPKSFMNHVGETLSEYFNQQNFDLQDFCVLHDDLETALGQVKYKFGQGAAGHNGLRSIDQILGNGYHRLRLGIGRPVHRWQVTDFVLSNFSKEEISKVHDVCDLVCEVLPYLVAADMQEVMKRCKNVS